MLRGSAVLAAWTSSAQLGVVMAADCLRLVVSLKEEDKGGVR